MALIDFSIGDIGNLFKDLREAITGKKIVDPEKRAELELKLAELEQALKLGQIEINKEEAKSRFWFIAGARPFILWVCGFAVAYHFILSPFLYSIFSAFGINFPLPKIDIGSLFNLMIAMLGLAGFRTYEKVKGVQDRH